MSGIPFLVNLAREIGDFYPLAMPDFALDDDFGIGIHPQDIFRARIPSILAHPRRRFTPYNRPLSLRNRRFGFGEGNALSSVSSGDASRQLPVSTVGKDGFQVCIDVSHFKPSELKVKTVENQVIVEGKHEEREDEHGIITRQFVRKYSLPNGFEPENVVSTISSDGVLTVKAPPTAKSIQSKERIVQIQQTGPAHLSVKNIEENDKSSDAQNGLDPTNSAAK